MRLPAPDRLRALLLRKGLQASAKDEIRELLAFLKEVTADERRFQPLGSLLDAGLLVVNEEGVVTYVNDRFAETAGLARSKVVGRTATSLFPAVEARKVRREFQHLREGTGNTYEARIARPDGRGAQLVVMPFSRFGDGGRFKGYFAVVVRATAEAGEEGQTQALTAALAARAALASLTAREREVLDALLAGDAVADIGEQLHISYHTARNHLKSIYRKLGVHSRVELVALLFGEET